MAGWVVTALRVSQGEPQVLYAISYILQTGTVTHRARSAKAALEAMALLKNGGATVVKIIVTRTHREISVADLGLLAADEVPVTEED